MREAELHTAHENDEYLSEERCHILEFLNTENDPEVSVARARVEPGVTTRLHRVAGTAERYLITSGAGEVDIEGLGIKSVSSGDVVCIPPGATQRIRNTGDDDLMFLCICTPRFEWSNYQDLGD